MRFYFCVFEFEDVPRRIAFVQLNRQAYDATNLYSRITSKTKSAHRFYNVVIIQRPQRVRPP